MFNKIRNNMNEFKWKDGFNNGALRDQLVFISKYNKKHNDNIPVFNPFSLFIENMMRNLEIMISMWYCLWQLYLFLVFQYV